MAFPTTFANLSNATGAQLDGNFNALLAPNGSTQIGFLQAGTGAIARTGQDKLREVVSVKDFGAVGDGITNDAPAILAAATYVNSFGGGKITFPNGHYLIDTALTIPTSISLDGGLIQPGEILPGTLANYGALSPTLIINSANPVSFLHSSGIEGFIVIRKGLTLPFPDAATATAGVAAFAGTALQAGTGVANTGFDVTFKNLLILGFNQAILSSGQSRVICDRVYGDCTNGISIRAAFDICRIDNCHFWPWTTVHQSWTTNALLRRSGIAYEYINGGDWNKITDSFSYGYQRGHHIGGCNNVSLIGCGSDNTSTAGVGDNPGAIGILIDGSSLATKLIGCQTAAQAQGFYISTLAGQLTQFTNCESHGDSNAGIYINGGDATIIGGQYYNVVNGVAIANAASNVEVDYCGFDLNTTDINCLVSTSLVKVGDHNNYGTLAAGSRPDNINNIPIPLTAAATLTLPTRGTDFAVSGNTNFGTILGGWLGREITVITSGTPSALHSIGANGIRLSGSINYSMTANASLKLRYNGTQWYEIGRAADFTNASQLSLSAAMFSTTPPSIASGFGVSPSISSANGTASFQINVGTGGAASSGVLTMPASRAGWNVIVSYNGSSANMNTYSVPSTTTSVTLTNQTSSTGIAVAWPSGQILNCIAIEI